MHVRLAKRSGRAQSVLEVTTCRGASPGAVEDTVLTRWRPIPQGFHCLSACFQRSILQVGEHVLYARERAGHSGCEGVAAV